ncbi:hypothetical protein SB724_20020, partial [Bacillus sp. SIMBA_031]
MEINAMHHLLKSGVIGLSLAVTLIYSPVQAGEVSSDNEKVSTPIQKQELEVTWKDVPTQTIAAGGVDF